MRFLPLLQNGVIALLVFLLAGPDLSQADPGPESDLQALPKARTDGSMSVETALASRRSRRRYSTDELSHATLGQLLWAAQGITDDRGHRTAPSAGARYPLHVYVLLPEGLYRYLPQRHAIERVRDRDLRAAMWKDVYARPWLADSPAIFVIAANYARTRAKYGKKAERFVHIEAGHVGQNLLLQATALGLHCVPIGAFHQRNVHATLGLPRAQTAIYLVAAGKPLR